MKSIEREVNETLWYAIMEEPYQGNEYFENDIFMVRPYDWNCDDEIGTNEYHFYHKPSRFKLYYYKYPIRSPKSNMNITHEQFYSILHDCMNSINPKIKYAIDRWWESNKE